MQLRDYQLDLVDRARSALRTHRRVIIQMATGGGKTPVGAHIIQRAAARNSEIWMIAHKNFLVEQASDKLRQFQVPHGIISSSTVYNPRQRVHVCSLGVLRNRRRQMRPPKLILWDECHHIGARTWAEIIDDYPETAHVGLTATPVRPGGGGLGDHFEDMVIGPSVADLVQWGKQHQGEGLCGYRYFSARHSVSGEGLHSRAGDFIAEELGQVMDKPAIIGDAVFEFKANAGDRRFLTFAPTVQFSEHIAEKYRDEGVNCVHLDGSTDKRTIKSALADLARGSIQGVSSVNLFLEGLDVTAIECVQWLRHTKSIVVKMQGDGRGMRNERSKRDLLILDHVENWKRFGMPDDEQDWSLDPDRKARLTDGASTTRECPKCYSRFSISKAVCPECKTVYPTKARSIDEIDGEMFELNPDDIRGKVKKPESPAMKAQRQTRTMEGLADLFRRQKQEKLGRPLTPDEAAAAERRAGYVIQARQAKRA